MAQAMARAGAHLAVAARLAADDESLSTQRPYVRAVARSGVQAPRGSHARKAAKDSQRFAEDCDS